MTEDNYPDDNKKPSQELLTEIEVFTEHHLNSIQAADEIIKLAEKEGISKKQLRKLIEKSLHKRGLKRAQIYAALPHELKRTYITTTKSPIPDEYITSVESPITGHVEEITTNAPEPDKMEFGNNVDPLLAKNLMHLRIEELKEQVEVGHEALQKMEEQGARIEELQLENGKLKEQIIEQREQVQSLVKSVNASTSAKPQQAITRITETIEYKSLATELEMIKQERDEYKQLATKTMKEHPEDTFQSANKLSPIQILSAVKQEQEGTALKEVILNMNLWKLLWKAQPYSQKVMYLKLEGNQVIGVESDTERNNKSGGK